MHVTSLLLATTMTVTSQAPATDAGVFPYEVRREQLDNGLTVLLVPMPSEGLVSYWSIVRTGSRDEVEKGVTGFAHFFEHMMFRGSERYPEQKYKEIVTSMGADQNAYTTDDYTAYHISFTSEDLPTVIDIEADRFQHLQYDEQQFKDESGAVDGEFRKGRTSPFSVMFEKLQDAAFDVHTYKHTTIGFEADIKDMPNQFGYSKSFFQRFYRPENVVLLIAGDFDQEAAMDLVHARYDGWQPGYVAPKVTPEPPQTAQRRVDIPFDGKTLPILTLAFKSPALAPDDRTMIAGTLLGELAFGSTSEVYKKLVLDEQRVDALFESFEYNRDPKLWSAFARVKDPSDVRAVEDELWAAIAGLQREPVPAEHLAEVASRLKYSFLSSLSTPAELCDNMARIIGVTGDIRAIETIYATLAQVTPEDVQRAAQLYLQPERCTVAVTHSAHEPAPAGILTVNGLPGATGAAEPIAQSALVTLPVRDPNVSFNLWFKVGSQDDPAGKEGLAALTASLLSDGGTKRHAYEKLLEALFPMAAGYYVSVDKEMTVFRGSVHKDKLDEYYDLFVEAVTEPGFRAEDFERLRDNTVSSIENSLRFSSDEELGKAALYGRVFEGTSYEHIDSGTVASLRALTVDDVKEFWRTHYTRENLVVGVGGGYPQDLPERLRQDLAALPSGKPTPVAAPRPAPIEGRHVLLVEKRLSEKPEASSTAISLGYPIDLHRGQRDFYALWIANSWLGEHRNSTSHLYQVIRATRGMNYGDYSYIEAFPNGGSRSMPPTGVGRRQQLFEVWIRPVPRPNAIFALRAALREVEHLAQNGLTAQQFEDTRRFLKKYSLHFAETSGERLGYAVDDRFYGTEDHLATFRKMMDELTLDDVNAAIRKYIQVDDLVIAMVTEDAAALGQALVAGDPTGIDYMGQEKPADVLAEDELIAAYPLDIPADNVTIVPVAEMFEGANLREAASPR